MGGGRRCPDRGLNASSGERGSSSGLSGWAQRSAAGETQMEGTDNGERGEETRRVGAAKRVWVYIVQTERTVGCDRRSKSWKERRWWEQETTEVGASSAGDQTNVSRREEEGVARVGPSRLK